MKVTALGQTVTFNEERILFAEARELEAKSGASGLPEFFEFVRMGKSAALQALVWIALRRHNPGLTYADLDNAELATAIAPDDDAEPAGGDDADPLAGGLDEGDDPSL